MKENRLNKKYNLEEHLKFLSSEDKDYESLYNRQNEMRAV